MRNIKKGLQPRRRHKTIEIRNVSENRGSAHCARSHSLLIFQQFSLGSQVYPSVTLNFFSPSGTPPTPGLGFKSRGPLAFDAAVTLALRDAVNAMRNSNERRNGVFKYRSATVSYNLDNKRNSIRNVGYILISKYWLDMSNLGFTF